MIKRAMPVPTISRRLPVRPNGRERGEVMVAAHVLPGLPIEQDRSSRLKGAVRRFGVRLLIGEEVCMMWKCYVALLAVLCSSGVSEARGGRGHFGRWGGGCYGRGGMAVSYGCYG